MWNVLIYLFGWCVGYWVATIHAETAGFGKAAITVISVFGVIWVLNYIATGELW